jgi:flagellar protein FlbD
VIVLTERDGTAICLNANVIETLEESAGTVITLTTGKRFMVRESVEEVISRVTEFLGRVHGGRRDQSRQTELAFGDQIGQDSIANAAEAAPPDDNLQHRQEGLPAA